MFIVEAVAAVVVGAVVVVGADFSTIITSPPLKPRLSRSVPETILNESDILVLIGPTEGLERLGRALS